MLTILQSLNLSAEYLEKKGIEDPKRNAELLLCKVLNCKKINLYLNFERPLSDDEVVQYRSLLKRRGEREPLQYIIGMVEFFGNEFKVNPSVLIPRPETELLVDKVIQDYNGKQINLLDIGTGSGNIAVSLCKCLPNSKITAMDLSEEALRTAAENSGNLGCSDRIDFVKANILQDSFSLLNKKYDVIVSNPPYISELEYNSLQPELKMHEPKIALSDYNDGLTFYRRIVSLSEILLNKDGRLYLEMGYGQSDKIKTLFTQKNFSNINIIKDYQGINRVISGDKK